QADDIEALVAGRGDLRDDLPVDPEAADERHEHARLAGDVGTQVPRIRAGHQRIRRPLGAFLYPVVGRVAAGFQRNGAASVEISDGVGDPVDVKFGMQHHVGEYRRTARTGDVE